MVTATAPGGYVKMSSRPDFFSGRQVICIEQIKAGERYAAIDMSGSIPIEMHFEVKRAPFQRDDESWWIKVQFVKRYGIYGVHEEYIFSLSDLGIFPYSPEALRRIKEQLAVEDVTINLAEGDWNPSNCLAACDGISFLLLPSPGEDCPCFPYHRDMKDR